MTTRGRQVGNQSTHVAFSIIESMAASAETQRLTALAQELGMPKARVFRYLRTLMSIGYVRQDPATERYRLTLKLFHLGQAIADSTKLLTEARPVMLRLSENLSHTVTLSQIETDGMRVLDIVRFESPVEIITRPGALLDFHCSAQGKVALAFGPPGLWEGLRKRGLKSWTRRTNVDPARLAREIELVAKRGWATAPEEVLQGVNALSAPIYGSSGQLEATLTIAGSVQSIKPEPSPGQINSLLEAARTISLILGCAEYPH